MLKHALIHVMIGHGIFSCSLNISQKIGAFSWLGLKTTELHLGIHFCSLEIYAVEAVVTEFAGLCIYV